VRLAFFIVLGIAVVLAIGAYVFPRQQREMLARGYTTRGRVTAVKERVTQVGHRNETWIWARYVPREGGDPVEGHQVELGLHKAWWEEHHPVGSEVQVFVDPTQPEQVGIEAQPNPAQTTRQLLTAAAVFGVLAAVLGWLWLRRG